MKPSPDNIEQLLSRIADTDLSPNEQTSLRHAVESNATSATAARQYKALAGLLASWRPLPADVSWDSFSQQVSKKVATADAAEIATVDAMDHLMRAATPQMPTVDWAAFKSRVSNAVHQEAIRQTATHRTAGSRRSLFLRLGAWATPFAAAAAIALIVLLQRDPAIRVVVPNVNRPAQPVVQVALYVPKADGSISFAFDRTSPEPTAEGLEEAGTAIAIGPPRTSAGSVAEMESLEDAFLY